MDTCKMEQEAELHADLRVLQERREAVIQALNELANELDGHHHRLKIAKTSLAAGGIVGSGLAIGGVLLAPVTLGASLGFTIAGTAVGISSGMGGLAAHIIERVLNGKTMNSAKREADEFAAAKVNVLQILDKTMDQDEFSFYTIVEDRIKKLDPTFYREIVTAVTKSSSPKSDGDIQSFLKMFMLAGVSAGKFVTNACDTASNCACVAKGAAAVGGVVLAAVSIPLDIVTIVTNSISIQKNTPAQTAQIIRKLAKELQGEFDDMTFDECNSEFTQKFMELKEEHTKHVSGEAHINERGLQAAEGEMTSAKVLPDEEHEIPSTDKPHDEKPTEATRKWLETITEQSNDAFYENEILALKNDFMRKLLLKVKLFWLLAHVLLATALVSVNCMLLDGKANWLSYFIGLGVVYDTFHFITVFGTPLYEQWVVTQMKTKLEIYRLTAKRICKLAPPNLPCFDECLSFEPITLQTQWKKCFVVEICLIVAKLFLTLSKFFSYRHVGVTFDILGSHMLLDGPFGGYTLLDGPISSLATAVGFVQYPQEAYISPRADVMEMLRIITIFLIWAYLTLTYVTELKHFSSNELSVRIINLGQDFEKRMNNIIEEAVTFK